MPPSRRRKSIPHDPPHFIGTSSAIFFITICCQARGRNQLCHPPSARVLLDAAKFYHDRHEWYVHLLVLMPDHLHSLVSFGPDIGMGEVIEKWKRYTATHAGVVWQRNYADHRLRCDESFAEKAEYMRQNPVRAGLVDAPEEWAYVMCTNPQTGQMEAPQAGHPR
jgi:putative transposase